MNLAIAQRLQALAKSKFRSKFKLPAQELQYLQDKGFETIKQHARDFIRQRLAPAQPENDGKQTPMKNHPVFIAQHATATCCRKCLEKWHHIPQGKLLTDEQVDFIIQLISQWLKRANQV